MKKSVALALLIALCLLVGLMVPFWPLVLLGVACAAFYAPVYVAFMIAIFIDLAFGSPTGVLEPLHFLFFIFAVICYLLKVFARRFFLERGDFSQL